MSGAFTFVVLGLLGTLVAYAICRLLYGSRIEALKERIRLRDDKLADLEKKVGTSDPDAIEAKFAEIQRRLKGAEETVYTLPVAPPPPSQ